MQRPLDRAEVRQAELRAVLNLDKSAISRRVAGALAGGFLENLEDRKGKPARLVLGDPLRHAAARHSVEFAPTVSGERRFSLAR
jgi:hypothetical protein